MELRNLVHAMALCGLAGAALSASAQDAAQKLERVEITGSSIKRVQDEGALPIQTIRASDLIKMGITSGEQLVSQLSANGNGIDNMVSNQGGDFLVGTANKAHNNGSAAASLRGLGAQYTLVLLNGRRMSTHGLNGQSVDLNSIPMAALDRVEILKDGASAIYGTDAIGGVINFILRKDMQGLEATAFADITQHGGGNIARGSVLFGAGDLERDRFNVMASLTLDTNKRLRGDQRDFVNGNQPERGLFPDTTGTPYATISTGTGSALASSFRLPGETATASRVNTLALQNQCDSYPGMFKYRNDITGGNSSRFGCSYDYGRDWALMQPVDRTNFVGRATFAVNNETTAYVEAVASRTKSAVQYTPIQLTAAGYAYPASGPYYQNLATLFPTLFKSSNADPSDNRVFFDATKPEIVRWRCTPCGTREQDTKTDAYRVLAGLDGIAAGWDYKLGLSTAQSEANTVYGNGNMFTNKLIAAMQTGLINPFLPAGQSQTPEAMALINGASATGHSLYGGKASVTELDGSISRELYQLPGGKLGVALGFDLRRETYAFTDGQETQEPVNGVSSAPSLPKTSRTIKAVYGELVVPVVKSLELQLAGRYDRYSDFGSTTNPKVAFRWEPVKQFLMRGSFSRGFHAPDYEALYGGDTVGAFNSDINDPELCPGGVGTVGCAIRPDISVRSNPNLKAEKSKQYSLGFVVSPASWFTGSIDFWRIQIDNRISALSGLALINNYERYKQYVVRDPDTGVISEVVAPFFNLAGDKTNGFDLNLSFNTANDWGRWLLVLDGTYTNSYKSRLSPADPWVERVNNFGGADFGYDLKLRWKHSAAVTWARSDWSVTLQQTYSSGYDEEVGGFVGFTPPQINPKIRAYTLYNLSASYSGLVKGLTLTAGIKNLFDKDPPFSAHNVDNVASAGWDSRVGDPRLRSFTLRANYKFW